MNIDKLQLGCLRTFVLIVDSDGIRGALRPGVTTLTTAYNNINSIENVLGRKLFKGEYKKENLTFQGKTFYTYAKGMIEKTDAAITECLVGGSSY